ncbi:MAG: hypothetical protein BWX60_01061 [Candidatus Marinimicrobia bacterium ADurb.Bin030]|nr:MAG: hypothetical protein BWX60_01061 [Candidatus Marinimicrobia bacterium ADurb.Bin030]
MATFIKIERFLNRFPAGIPNIAIIVDVKEFTVVIQSGIIITVARYAPEASVAMKTIATAGMRNDGKKILTAEIIDPGIRGFRRRDNIFPVLIVKMTEFQN